MLLIAIGFGIGILLGLTGAGGSVFAVPLLMIGAGLSLSDAAGISLGAVASTTLFASLINFISRYSLNHTQKNNSKKHTPVLWMPGLILASSGIIFAPLGRKASDYFSENFLISFFVFLAIIIASRMWLTANREPDDTKIVRANSFTQVKANELICNFSSDASFEFKPRCLAGLILGGSLAGFLSGFLGVGGGFLIIPLLMALSAISMLQAVSTSLLIIAVISSAGFSSYLLFSSHIQWLTLNLVAMGGIAGMIAGKIFSHKIAGPTLQKFFSASLLLICLILIITRWQA